MRHSSCVYLYRDSTGKPRYVGRGDSVQRALDHTSGSHNPDLAELIESDKYTVEVAGPYSPDQAVAVESALIAVLRTTPRLHLLNRREETGETFRPLGVPAGLSARQSQLLSMSEIGQRAGGALIVRIGPKKFTDGTRAKFDPLSPADRVIAENTVRWWHLAPLLEHWHTEPEDVPNVILGAAGPPAHRYIPAALTIDRGVLAAQTSNPEGDQVPVALDVTQPDDADLDAAGLRGCIVTDALFGRMRQDHVIWVDSQGTVRYATSPRLAKVARY